MSFCIPMLTLVIFMCICCLVSYMLLHYAIKQNTDSTTRTNIYSSIYFRLSLVMWFVYCFIVGIIMSCVHLYL